MHESAELVRRGYEAFNKADIETLTEILDENASWHTPGRGILAGDPTAARRSSSNSAGMGRIRREPPGPNCGTCADDEGRVVAMHHNSGTRAGKRLDVDSCIVFEIKDGRCTSGREHFYDLNAWDEFWS